MSRVQEAVYNLWVRMWREHDADGDSWEWRGQVKESTSREDRSFRRMEGLIDAINVLTSEPPPDGDGDEPAGPGA